MTNNKLLPKSWVQKIAPEQLVQLIKSAVHFGHSVNCWNPKMFPYIYTEKNGLHIIDLVQTAQLLDKACNFVYEAALENKTILFVGTKPPFSLALVLVVVLSRMQLSELGSNGCHLEFDF